MAVVEKCRNPASGTLTIIFSKNGKLAPDEIAHKLPLEYQSVLLTLRSVCDEGMEDLWSEITKTCML